MVFVFSEEHIDLQNYYQFENAFSETEIQELLKKIVLLPESIGGIGNNHELNISLRKSTVKWLPHDTFDNLYRKIIHLIEEANKNLFHFDLKSITEKIQYTEYHAPDGHYDFHQDIGVGNMSLRKLSITIQLSNPSEYVGGEFQYYKGGKYLTTISKKKGSVCIFPSYMLHRVTPVTEGIRKSLVLWVGGSHFR